MKRVRSFESQGFHQLFADRNPDGRAILRALTAAQELSHAIQEGRGVRTVEEAYPEGRIRVRLDARQ